LQSNTIRIGTRGSPLALAQANQAARLLTEAGGGQAIVPDIVPIRTSGDAITDRSLIAAGGKGLFTKEIDDALLDGRIDIAVHSAKDMPTRLPEGLCIAACLKREDVRDAFLSAVAPRLVDLPRGAVLGTSSLRRKAMALRARPDLKVVDMRGNVETRLRKLAEGTADATFLALAGLRRLGLEGHATSLVDAHTWLPAVGQGTIAVMTREGDDRARALVAEVDDRDTSITLVAERAFLAVLDGSCRTPIGGLATLEDGSLVFRGIIVKPDGSDAHETENRGPIDAAETIGAEAGAVLARHGGSGFFDL
jgi:hydroxymethylbilane synthase